MLKEYLQLRIFYKQKYNLYPEMVKQVKWLAKSLREENKCGSKKCGMKQCEFGKNSSFFIPHSFSSLRLSHQV